MLNYNSDNQLKIEGFETPFYHKLNRNNRWVKLAEAICWDDLVAVYIKKMSIKMGRKCLNPRLVIGALIIKHMEALSDRAVVEHITENPYMQYFCGFESMLKQAPFDPSMFVHFRKRLGVEEFEKFSQHIVNLAIGLKDQKKNNTLNNSDGNLPAANNKAESGTEIKSPEVENTNEKGTQKTHKGILKIDATAVKQNITYPTDIKLLDASRQKSEELIDFLYDQGSFDFKKPRTYREKARKEFIILAKQRKKSFKTVQKVIKQQLQYLRRNIQIINTLIDRKPALLSQLSAIRYKYLLVIQELYRQQKEMHQQGTNSTQNRIVSIHQPQVRPILRGKDSAKTEFGAKINASTIEGFTFIDQAQWENYNEGTKLIEQVQQFEKRFGHLPEYVLADKIYHTRENRKYLKDKGIKITGKPLGRPSKEKNEMIDPKIHNQRNHIEGKFGQLKTARHLGLNKAKLASTAMSWIAASFFITNLLTLLKRFFGTILQYTAINRQGYLALYQNDVIREYLKIIMQDFKSIFTVNNLSAACD